LDDDASVRIDALSVRRLFAVAVEYVVGCPGAADEGVRWVGMAEAGDVVGNGWSNCMACELKGSDE
jgi:hypothetical protein